MTSQDTADEIAVQRELTLDPEEIAKSVVVCGNDLLPSEGAQPEVGEPCLPPVPLSSYIPKLTDPIKLVLLNFHIFQDSHGGGHYKPAEMARLRQIMAWINARFRVVAPPSDPIHPSPVPITDTRLRFWLNRVEFYRDDALHVSTDVARLQAAAVARNPSTLECVNVYITNGVFGTAGGFATLPVCDPNHPSSIVSLIQYTPEPLCDWLRSQNLCHEIGHVLDLYHTYAGGAGAADCSLGPEFLVDVFGDQPSTCPHLASWGTTAAGGDPKITNNLMGGNKEIGWISGLQAARMHRALTWKSVKRYWRTEEPPLRPQVDIRTHEIGDHRYTISASPINLPSDYSYWWGVSEVDAAGVDIPRTTVDNPRAWWMPFPCQFRGYRGTSRLGSIEEPGVFEHGKRYRIKFGAWSESTPWVECVWVLMRSRSTLDPAVETGVDLTLHEIGDHYYSVGASTVNPPAGGEHSWGVSEVDSAGAEVPGTTVNDPRVWSDLLACDFRGYQGISSLGPTTLLGTAEHGKRYRYTLGLRLAPSPWERRSWEIWRR